MIAAAIAAIVLGALIMGGTMVFLKKRMAVASGTELTDLVTRFKQVDAQLAELSQYVDSYASKGQFEALTKLSREIEADLAREKKALIETEHKLEAAQESVEKKESAQQEVKSAKQEDEEKLAQLLSSYAEISQESIQLEQRLAVSLKNLDAMMEELELNADQRAVIEELSNALTSAGSLLRDLITEHAALNERLEMLKQQHNDLEDEYTRLVEQQLGE